jgi:hypothetical protein
MPADPQADGACADDGHAFERPRLGVG